MSQTLFRPQLDGRLPASLREPNRTELASIRFLLRQSQTRVAGELPHYFTESEQFEDWLDEIDDWIQKASGRELNQVLLAIAALDYFQSRIEVPEQFGSREQEFSFQRTKQTMLANMARSLAWKLVLDLIPGTEPLHAVLTRQVHQAVMQVGIFEDVAIEFDLQIPAEMETSLPGKGGADWLRRPTIRAWQQIKTRLEAGKPCLVELIRDSADRCATELDVVVAYQYDETLYPWITLDCYTPRVPEKPVSISVNLQAEELAFTEHSLSDDLPLIRGMLVWNYRRKTPPTQGWYAWLVRQFVPAFWWRRQRRKAVMQIDASRHDFFES